MLTTTELLKRVRKIEIKTKGLSNHIFAGEYHSAFKGRGMSFSEVREYQVGDDVKNIDWNVTARFKTPFVKIFDEERELTVMLLVDVSGSSLFGTRMRSKRELITEISAVLGFSANTNNDKVGVLFFSDKVEQYIPPKKGRSHMLRIIRELIALEPRQSTTQVAVALDYLNQVHKKRTITFLLSDMVSAPFDKPLQHTARRHQLVGVQVYDRFDEQMPDVGLLQIADAETGKRQWVDTGDKQIRRDYETSFTAHQNYCRQLFRKNGASLMRVRTDADYVKILQAYFKAQ